MNIKELKRLAEAATPGPWSESDGYAGVVAGKQFVAQAYGDRRADCINNAAYIAAANPAAILELIRQRDELLAALEQERNRLDWALKHEACYYQWGGVWRLCFSSTTGPCDEDIDSADPRATIDELMVK